jgi:L-2-hydroxycarboxylate dehydrogenase (NAD+)
MRPFFASIVRIMGRAAVDLLHRIIALDVAGFVDPAVFAVEAQRQLEELRTSARLPGIERIRLPGDDRATCRRDRSTNGGPPSPQVLARLDATADALRIARLAR